jgi:hypothetical protein
VLSVEKSGGGSSSIEMRSTAGGTPFIDFSNNAAADFDMRLLLAGDDTLLIDGGDVGIGQASPAQKLHVNGNVRADG